MLVLKAKTARELMTPEPVSLAESAGMDEAMAFVTERGYGAAVVIDDAGHPLGVVTKTDILVHAKQHPAVGDDTTTVSDVMTPAVFSVREDATAKQVVEQMLLLNVHHLFVVDDEGVVVGVISPLDIVRRLG
ncbi:MAG TPA: CBS domain-containing protein [Fimbriiglobus sp.]|jgi:CBS domain-containing protein